MTITFGQPAPPRLLTEPPGIPCEMTPELLRLTGSPDPLTAFKVAIDARERNKDRLGGLHVSDLGYAVGLCQRQLWLRERAEGDGQEPDWPKKFGFWRGHETEDAFMQLLLEGLVGWRIERHLDSPLIHRSGQVFHGELDVLLSKPPRSIVYDFKEVDDNKLARLDAPRPTNVAQVQGYCMSQRAERGGLIYSGRWSEPKEFWVPRDDEATEERMQTVLEVVQLPDAPQAPAAKVCRGNELQNGSRSVKLDLPWQCETTVNGYTHRCPFLDHGCDGALKKSLRGHGIWGHLKDGKFKTKAGMEPAVEELGPARLAELILEET